MLIAPLPGDRVPDRDGERRSGIRADSNVATARSPTPTERPPGPGAALLEQLRRVAFWVAVVLPVLYVPLLLSPAVLDRSIPTIGAVTASGSVVVAIVALHLFVVVLGHGYARRRT